MKKRISEQARAMSCVYSLALVLCGLTVSAQALTPSGTQISTSSSANYSNSSGTRMPTATSNTVTVTVGQVADVAVTPATRSATVEPGSTGYVAVTIENRGNGSDKFNLSLTGASGWSPSVVFDTNGDGVHQSTETTQVSVSATVARGASYKCFVTLAVPSSASVGTSASVTLTASSTFDSTQQAQGTYTCEAGEPPAQQASYIRDWLMNGYYSNSNASTRLSTDYLGNEASAAPRPGTTQGGKSWSVLNSSTDDVNFHTAYGSLITNAVTYACTYVYSPTAQNAQLWMGSDDGLKVWLNGSLVKTSDVHRSHVFDQDKVSVNLTAGWNRLLIKVSQRYVDWKLSTRVCDASGAALDGIQISVDPQTGEEEEDLPPVISGLSAANVTTNSATVRWSTNEQTTGVVSIGLSSTSLSTTVRSDTPQTEASVNLSGLSADTTYYYSVQVTDIGGNTTSTRVATFRTSANSTGGTTDYIRHWLLNGAHANSNTSTILSNNYLGEGEAYAAPTPGMSQGGKVWTATQTSNNYLDFLTVYGSSTSYAAAYACTYIYSPTARSVQLRIGSDDGAKMWLNGKTIYTNNAFQSYVPDQNSVSADLFAGWNRLLVKVSQRSYDWKVSVKICDASGNAIPGVYAAAAPTDNAAPVVSNVQVTDVTSTGMTVTWTTDKPTSADVFYGSSSPTSRAGYGVMRYEHSVQLKGLSPSTNYYLKVGGQDACGHRGERNGYQQATD